MLTYAAGDQSTPELTRKLEEYVRTAFLSSLLPSVCLSVSLFRSLSLFLSARELAKKETRLVFMWHHKSRSFVIYHLVL